MKGTTTGRGRRTWMRGLAILTGVLTLALATAPQVIRGRRFGRLIERALPEMRGRVHVGGGSWTWGSVWSVARGRPAAFVLEDVRITDPDEVEVFRARRTSARLEITSHPLRVIAHDLRVTGAVWRMAETKDRRGIGFVAAFEPRAKLRTGAAAGATAAVPITIRLEDVRLDELNADFDLPGWALALRNVSATGQLAFEPDRQGRPVFTFDVTGADVRGGGQVAVLDGTRRSLLPFSSAAIARIATTAAAPDAIRIDVTDIRTGHSRSTLRGGFTGVFPTSGASRPAGVELGVHIDGADDALQAIARSHGWDRRLTLAGPTAAVDVTFSGPIAAPEISATGRGLDVRFDALAVRALSFRLEGAPAAQQLRLRQLTFDSPTGGRLTLDAALDRDLVNGRVTFDRFDAGPFLPAPLRPYAGGTLNGHVAARADLQARTAAIDEIALHVTRPPGVSSGPAVVHLLTARAAAPARARGELVMRLAAPRLRGGVLDLPRVTSSLWGGRVTATGRLALWDPATADWIPAPSFDLAFEANRISFPRLIGSDFAAGTLSLRARAKGTWDTLTFDARLGPEQRLRVLGEWVHLPPAINLTVDPGGLSIPTVELRGDHGTTLTAQGHIDMAGRLALDVTVDGFPLRKLPALADLDIPLDGRLQGHLRLSGARSAPEVAGQFEIVDARFQGRPIGGGSLLVTPGPGGGIRARGRVIEGMTADGSLSPARGGTRGDVTLTLAHLRLDPFLGWLPGGATVAGVVSGIARAHVEPGQSPSIDARLSELALLVTLPPAATTAGGPTTKETASPPATIDFHADSEVHLSAQAGGGPMRMDRARFAGTAGTLELAGQTSGGAAQGQVRGRLELKALAPLVAPWAGVIAGSLDFDANASIDAAGLHPHLRGSVSIATPIVLGLRRVPIDARIASGRIALTERDATVENFAFGLGRETVGVSGRVWRANDGVARMVMDVRGALDPRLVEPFARGTLRQIDGSARLTAHLEGPLAAPTLRARLGLDGVAFVLLPGATRIRFAGGTVRADERGVISFHSLDLRIGAETRVVIGADAGPPGVLRLRPRLSDGFASLDLPARGSVSALATPFAIIDDASFAVRLTGDSPRNVQLTGDVSIKAAHVPPSLRRAGRAAAMAPKNGRFGSELDHTKLDLRVHSTAGAIRVEIDHAPDPRVDLDYHVTGTVAHPEVSGRLEPKGIYSSLVMFLARLFE